MNIAGTRWSRPRRSPIFSCTNDQSLCGPAYTKDQSFRVSISQSCFCHCRLPDRNVLRPSDGLLSIGGLGPKLPSSRTLKLPRRFLFKGFITHLCPNRSRDAKFRVSFLCLLVSTVNRAHFAFLFKTVVT